MATGEQGVPAAGSQQAADEDRDPGPFARVVGAIARRPATTWLRRTGLARFVYGYLIVGQASDLAAAVAFHALLYVFPLLGAMLTVLGLVLQDPQRLARVSVTIVQIFPAATWRDSLQGLLVARNNAGLLGIISAIGLFWLGSSLLASLARAFNELYGVPQRAAVEQRLLALALIVMVAVLLFVTVVAAAAARELVGFMQGLLGLQPLGLGLTARVLGLGTGLATAFALFLALYWTVPNLKQRFRDVWPGAAVAAVLFVAVTQLFPLYLRLAPTNRYGAVFSLVFLLTTWFYLLAHLTLLGAALNAFRYAERRPAQPGERPHWARSLSIAGWPSIDSATGWYNRAHAIGNRLAPREKATAMRGTAMEGEQRDRARATDVQRELEQSNASELMADEMLANAMAHGEQVDLEQRHEESLAAAAEIEAAEQTRPRRERSS